MVKVKIEWTEESLKKYIMYKFLFSNKFNIAAIAAFIVCFAAVVVSCVAMFFMIESIAFLVVAGVVALLAVGITIFFIIRVNKAVKSSAKSGQELAANESMILTEDKITAAKNGIPFRETKWEEIASIDLNDKGKAAYLSTKSGAAIILEYKNIINGTEKELREMLLIKNVKLSEKA